MNFVLSWFFLKTLLEFFVVGKKYFCWFRLSKPLVCEKKNL